MDIDRGFLAASLREGFSSFAKLKPAYVEGDAIRAYEFINEYYVEYKTLPTTELVMKMTGIDLDAEGIIREPSAFFLDAMFDRFVFRKIQSHAEELAEMLSDHQPSYSIMEKIKEFSLNSELLPDNEAKSVELVFSNNDDLMEDYVKASKMGITGIDTGWNTTNQMTLGWQSEDFVLIAARPGVGKTWMLIIIMLAAWRKGHRVIICSTEMSRLALKRRIVSVILNIPYTGIKKGNLNDEQFERFQKGMKQLEADKNILIMGSMSLKMKDVERAIIMEKPEAVFIDGIYMADDDEKRNNQRGDSNTYKNVKVLNKRYKIPVIATTQMNRADPKAPQGKPSLDRLAYSDAAGQYADYVFFIRQTAEMRQDKRLDIEPAKCRDSEFPQTISIKWDFHNGQFFEIPRPMPQANGKPSRMELAQPREDADIPF